MNIKNKQHKNHAKDSDTELNKFIFKESVDLVYRSLPTAALATMIISVFLVAVLWRFSDTVLLSTWLASMIIINLVRFCLYKVYLNRITSDEEAVYWDKWFYITLIINVTTLSSITLFFLPETDSVYHYFPEMILIGIAAGAITSLSYRMRNVITYFIVLFLPMFIVEIMYATYLSYSAATLILLLYIFLMKSAHRFNRIAVENITLQFTVKKHNKELIKSEQVARDANSAKSRFISLISHELRTPLNAILGFSQLVQMSDEPKLNREQEENIQGIQDSGKHLLSLIQELLDLSSIESNNMTVELEQVSLAATLEKAIAILNPAARESQVEIINNVEDKFIVIADEKRLKQVFINLISNAIKYNKTEGRIILDATGDKRIRISIRDTGPGMTAEQQDKLFVPFQRFNTSKEGIGLGLYIVYHLLSMMNSKIHVESEPGNGATFWFELDESLE